MNYTNKELKNLSKSDLEGNWGSAIILLIVSGLLTSLLNQLFSSLFGTSMPVMPTDITSPEVMDRYMMQYMTANAGRYGAIALLVQPIAGLVDLGIDFGFLDMIDGYKLKLEYVISAFSKKFVRNFLSILLKIVILTIGSALFIIPGIIFYFMFMPVSYLLKDRDDLDVLSIFKESRRLMIGHKGNVFKLVLPYFLMPILLGIVTVILLAAAASNESMGGVFSITIVAGIAALVLSFYVRIKTRTLFAGYYRRNLAPIVKVQDEDSYNENLYNEREDYFTSYDSQDLEDDGYDGPENPEDNL